MGMTSLERELLSIRQSLIAILYRELGVILQRVEVPLNTIFISSEAQYLMMRKNLAIKKLTVYDNIRKRLTSEITEIVKNPPVPPGMIVKPLTDLILKSESFEVSDIPDEDFLTYLHLSGLKNYTITINRYPAYGELKYDAINKKFRYSTGEFYYGWNSFNFTIKAENVNLVTEAFIQTSISSPDEPFFQFKLPTKYKRPKVLIEEFEANTSRSETLLYYGKNRKAPETPTGYRHEVEKFNPPRPIGHKFEEIYFDYPDDSLRINRETGTLITWDEAKSEFVSEPAREPLPEVIPQSDEEDIDKIPDALTIDNLEYNGLHYTVKHLTNEWSSLLTSTSHNVMLTTNVSIDVELLILGSAANNDYIYRITLVNHIANSILKNITVSPVTSIDNKDRRCELFINRNSILTLVGKKRLDAIRDLVLQDLRMVFLVH